MSIWDKKEIKSKSKIDQTLDKELLQEVKDMRKGREAFESSVGKENYLIVVFSSKVDKDTFIKETKVRSTNCLVDGYELAQKLNLQPKMPTVKLLKPFKK